MKLTVLALVLSSCSTTYNPYMPMGKAVVEEILRPVDGGLPPSVGLGSIGDKACTCRISNSIVAVSAKRMGGLWSEWIGSGVVVGNGSHVLTAFHVVEEGTSFDITPVTCRSGKFEMGASTDALPLAWKRSTDVAILEASAAVGPPLQLSVELPPLGTMIWLYGMRSMGTPGFYSEAPSDGVARAAGSALPGDSGGAIVGPDGHVIGVVIRRGIWGGHYVFVPTKEVVESLEEMK